MTALRLGSLFDGIGVFPLAAVRCGIEPVWASEIENAPISITKRHFPDRRTFMEQERNPNKNAELAMEQNGNMIDGIINNLPVPPRSEKPLDKVREHPPKRRSREREER